MRLTTLLRRLLGVTQMYVKQVEMAADGPLTVSVCQATSGIDPPATPKTDPSKKRRMLLKWWVFR